MSLPYNFIKLDDGTYNFVSEQGYNYLIYFSQSILSDAENNIHTVLNLGFSRNGKHDGLPFLAKHDSSIRTTIILIINDFFEKNDHKAIIYFCFGDDGYARHRNIVFNQWSNYLDSSIEKYNSKLTYENNDIYASLLIVKDNPLKKLILDAFNVYLKDLQGNSLN